MIFMNLKIIHGSCEWMSEIEDNSVGGCVTSPPYFNAKDYGEKVGGNIGNADIDTFSTPYQNYLKMMKNVFAEVYRVLKDGRYFLMNAAPIVYDQKRFPVPYHLFNLMEEVGFTYADNIIWKKPDGITSSKRFGIVMQQPYPLYYKPNNVYEPCFLMRKGKPDYPKEQHKIEIETLKKFQNDVWQIQPDTHNDHPAPYPYQLPWRFIYALVPRNETVLDPFGGSGTTAVAARDLDVDCVLYELESHYIDMIKNRVAANKGLGKFVDGAKDIQLEVVQQKEIKKVLPLDTPLKKISDAPANAPKTKIDLMAARQVGMTEGIKKIKQVEIHKRRLYMCDICDIEWEISDNNVFDYAAAVWKFFEGNCPNCGIKMREVS